MYVTVRPGKRALLAAAFAVLCGLLLSRCALSGQPASAAPGASEGGVALPIVMYHSFLKDPARQGQYVISPKILEDDMKHLCENGYSTIGVAELLDYVNDGKPLPPRPVMLTMDDGYYNNYLYAFPLAKRYSCKLVLAPIGYYTDKYTDTADENASYSHVTWAQLVEMDESGLVEIQNHSYNLHASKGRLGTRRLGGETLEDYSAMLSKDLTRMQDTLKEHLGHAPTAFVYPFGAISKAAPEIIKGLGFAATLTCESRLNHITRDPACLFGLGRYLRPPDKSSAAFFAGLK